MTGCPGLVHVETDYGPKMDTSLSTCVHDGACERVGACSSFERLTIKRKRPPRTRVPELGLDDIPEPAKRPVGDIWRACLTGVGGMGAGVATQVELRELLAEVRSFQREVRDWLRAARADLTSAQGTP